jgi:TonB family protein
MAGRDPDAMESAAKAAASVRRYDVAQKLLESALAIRAQSSGQQSAAYARTLLKLGDVAQRQNRAADAEGLYRQAAAIFGDRPDSSRALIRLGLTAIARKSFDEAYDDFQRMKAANPEAAASATMWMAVARHRQGNYADADALFRQALAMQEPNSPDTATTLQLHAMTLEQEGRADEAKAARDRATTLRKQLREQATPSGGSGGTKVYRIGNGVSAPKLVSKLEPEYTDEARAAQLQGTTVVYAEIGPDGLTRNVRVISGLGLGLDEKAVEAINLWRFQPGTKDGEAVTVAATIEVNFRLL